MKTSSSKAAMIMEKPENEILLLQDILPCFYWLLKKQLLKKQQLEMSGFEQTQETKILK